MPDKAEDIAAEQVEQGIADGDEVPPSEEEITQSEEPYEDEGGDD
jgi:hypothetical protein